jgi:site-specific DNA-methyltransferase (adenine-specific)
LELKELSKESYYHEKGGMLLKGDCLNWMDKFPDKSIDMILCDLPYGTTACKWDEIIPFDKLWLQYERIIKDGGAICLFGSEPFSSKLRMSNLKLYKYDWIWNKKLAGNGILAKRQPLKIHEIVSVFNSKIYYPQKTKGKFRKKMGLKESEITGGDSFAKQIENDEYYPTSIQEFGIGNLRIGRLHPTQKPVDLLEYLIKTYTIENEIILDNTAGSCSTAIASKNTNRKWICIEQEEKYCDLSVDRIKNYKTTP